MYYRHKRFKAIQKIPVSFLSPFQRAVGSFVNLNLNGAIIDAIAPISYVSIRDKAEELVEDLTTELFWHLYPSEYPSQLPAPDFSRAFIKEVISGIKSTKEFAGIKEQCGADIINSALISQAIAEYIINTAQLELRRQLMNQHQGQGEDQGESQGEDQELTKSQKQSIQNIIREIINGAQEDVGDDGCDGSLMKMVKNISASKKLADGWSQGAEVQMTEKSIDAAIDMVNEIRDSIDTITSLMGRLKGHAQESLAKKIKEKGTVVRDGFTRELQNLFPSELALLRKDVPQAIRAEKIGNYADRGLLGMVASPAGEKEGSLVIAIDDSGSMDSQTSRGKKSEVATALSLAVAMTARDNKQRFNMFKFSDTNQSVSINDMGEYSDLCSFMAKSFSGGTDFSYAIKMCMKSLDALGEENKRNADVLFLTDGQCGTNSDTLKDFANNYTKPYKTRFILFIIDSSAKNRLDYAIEKLINPNEQEKLEKEREVAISYIGQGNRLIMELYEDIVSAAVIVSDIGREIESVTEKLQRLLVH